MVQIITDTASDFSAEDALANNIIQLPMSIQFGDTVYKDRITLTADEFYNKLIESDALPSTSQVNPYDFKKVYKDLTANNDSAVVITLSGQLSGTAQSAWQAAKGFDNIYTVDSESGTVGEQVLIRYAMQLRDEGASAQEIAEHITSVRERIRVLALLDTLEYLKKGGRISSGAALAGNLLSIKPVISIRDGKVEMLGKARGSKNGNNMLRELIGTSGGIDYDYPVVLGYSGISSHLLDKYVMDSTSIWEGHEDSLSTTQMGSTVGTHLGPGAIAIGFISKE